MAPNIISLRESQLWTDNWGAEDLRVPSYTIPLKSFCYFFCLLMDLIHFLYPHAVNHLYTNVTSPPLALRWILYPSGSSRWEVTSHTRLPDLINHWYVFPLGFSWDCLTPSSVSPSQITFFCLACCCFFLRMPILLVLAIPKHKSNVNIIFLETAHSSYVS